MTNYLKLNTLFFLAMFVTSTIAASQNHSEVLAKSPAKTDQLWRELSESQAKKQELPIPSWAPLVEKTQDAVVVIRTEAMVQNQPMEFQGIPGPFRFFAPAPPEKQRGQGSGFIINEDGYIVTNQHVIEGAQKIIVTVGKNPREYNAKIIGSDEALDIALIKINEDNTPQTKGLPPNTALNTVRWPFLPLGDSDKVRLGDWVMALGSPLGLLQSVNIGIVSQKHRGGIQPSGRDLYVELMQLQMPINPGNSGGPVLDTSGRVIAISESILASGQSIAFGVPINIVKDAIEQLRTKGKIIKAFLGVEPTDLTPQYAQALGLSQNDKGAVIIQIRPGTPAAKAGLKPMDVILEIDGQPVSDSFNLRQQTAYKGVGKNILLKIYRKGLGFMTKTVKLEIRPDQEESLSQPGTTDENLTKIEMDGISLFVQNTPDKVLRNLQIHKDYPGAEVVKVYKKSSYDLIDLQSGDVIVKVNETQIKSAKQLKDIFNQAKPETTLLLLTRRENAERFVPVTKK